MPMAVTDDEQKHRGAAGYFVRTDVRSVGSRRDTRDRERSTITEKDHEGNAVCRMSTEMLS